jgi:hypothetical protein
LSSNSSLMSTGTIFCSHTLRHCCLHDRIYQILDNHEPLQRVPAMVMASTGTFIDFIARYALGRSPLNAGSGEPNNGSLSADGRNEYKRVIWQTGTSLHTHRAVWMASYDGLWYGILAMSNRQIVLTVCTNRSTLACANELFKFMSSIGQLLCL